VTLLVPRRQLRLGPLLAEGGEGRVYELVDRPDQVFKAFRRPQPQAGLVDLVTWASSLAPAGGARVRASTSWPLGVVVEGAVVDGPAAGGVEGKRDAQTAAGLLLPRAPRRFSLRHRDGRTHLASLSYLTADPARRSAAYGISLPDAMSPDRLGLVYALARLLEAFESASPRVSHGDLSAKNVLWSLARGPEVFVLDCDNGERWVAGRPLGPPERRRAMTPNWDDPAVTGGTNPGAEADRYSLALIFLRVCGAAHFPIQKRQKAGEAVELEVGVPGSGRRARSLGVGAPLWELCARGLGTADPSSRPPAAAWVEVLQTVIEDLGATRVLDAVWASQGRALVAPPATEQMSASVGEPAAVRSRLPATVGGPASGRLSLQPGGPAVRAPSVLSSGGPLPMSGPPVIVRPVAMDPRLGSEPPRSAIVGALAATGTGWTAARTATGGVSGAGGLLGTGSGRSGWMPAAAAAGRVPAVQQPSPWAQLRHLLHAVLTWMLEEHRRTLRYLRTPARRRRGLLRIPWCMAVDFLAGCVVLFLVAMVASPFLGI
jgi:hypothetical protein